MAKASTKRERAERLRARVTTEPTAGAHPPATYQAVSELITPNPPSWLNDFLREWSSSIMLANGVEAVQPSRVEVLEILSKMDEASGLLIRALNRTAIMEFVNSGPKGPTPRPDVIGALLRELAARVRDAARSDVLVTPGGKAKPGRGVAVPKTPISAQTYCALLIAEAYKHFAGNYPAPKNLKVAEAAENYWYLAGGERQSWGSNRLTAWRPHFKKALSPDIARLPELATSIGEMRRHLHIHDQRARNSGAA